MKARLPLPRLLLALLVGAHGAWLLASASAGVLSPDAHGYLLQARLLAEGHLPRLALESPVQLVGTHWVAGGDDVVVSRYPPGFPLLLAPVRALAGTGAVFLVGPLLAGATLLAVYSLARRTGGPWAGLTAAVVLAATPVFDFYALNGDSHTPATFGLIGGLALLLRYTDQHEAGRARAPLGVAAGLLLGSVPAMRYAEAVCLAPIALFLGARRAATWPAVGAAVSVGGLLALNRATHGAWGSTGYAATGEEAAFAWANVAPHLAGYLQLLPREGLGPWAILAAVGLGAGLTSRPARSTTGLPIACFAANLAVYLGFYFGPGSERGGHETSIRYLLPTLPCLVVVGVGALWAAPWRAPAVAAALALQLAWSVPRAVEDVAGQAARSEAVARFVRATTDNVPAGAVVVAPVPLAEALDVVGWWRVAGAEVLALEGSPETARRAGRTPDRPAARLARPSRWNGLEGRPLREAILRDAETWAASAPVVVWTDRPDELTAWLPPSWGAAPVARVTLPELRDVATPGRGAGDDWEAWELRRRSPDPAAQQ